jgi:hypothetical protein
MIKRFFFSTVLIMPLVLFGGLFNGLMLFTHITIAELPYYIVTGKHFKI